MDQAPNISSIDLRHYLAIVRSRKLMLVAVTVGSILIALVISSRQTPQFRAQTELLLKSDPAAGLFPNAENEAALVASAPVAGLVADDLQLNVSRDALLSQLSVQRATELGDVLIIQYVSEDPEQARDIANSFAENYISFKTREGLDELGTERRIIERKIEKVRAQLDSISAEIRGTTDDSRKADLESDRTQVSARLQVLLQDIDDLEGGAVVRQNIAQITKPAIAPAVPFRPNHPVNGLLGALVGLLAGVGLAFLLERLDDRFRGRPDVERALESPVLATVPKLEGRTREVFLPAIHEPRGAASEAFRNLRTGLQFISSQRNIRTILITSASAGEGKTSITANLGIAMGQTGKRAVLVSADLRRPSLESVLGADASVGLSTWLLGDEDDLTKLVLEHPELPNLSLLPSGPIPSNPAELLTSPRLQQLFTQLERAFDIVLVDSPPILPVADSVILASHVGAVVLVIDAAATARSDAVHGKEQIERVDGNIVGVVLNAFDPGNTPYYYEPYHYSQYYGTPAESEEQQNGQPPVPTLDDEAPAEATARRRR